jgi:IS1 family transposase
MDRQAYLDAAGVSDADWEQTPVSVKRLVEVLIERIEHQDQHLKKMQSDIEWLKEKLTRDSSNSSIAPSTDKGKRRYPQRKSRGKQRGGQPGHELHTRTLYAVEACKSVEDYYPKTCWKCGLPLHQEEGEPHRHQIVELPVIVPEVKEYRLHQCVCQECNVLTRATLPAAVSAKGYGPRVVATVGVLSAMYRQSQRMVQEGMLNLFGIKLSLGSINNMRHESSEAVSRNVSDAQDYVQRSSVVGADETSFRQGNNDGNNPNKRKAWLWIAVTPLVTFFQVTLSRSQASAKALLGEAFSGHLITDRYSAYTWIELVRRQLCWAHLKRDFTQIAERSGVSKELGEALLNQEKSIFELWHRFREGNTTRPQLMRQMEPLRLQLKALLNEGAAYPVAPQENTPLAKTVRTCRRLLTLEPAMWLFVSVEGVEPTNNDSERGIRAGVIWRKLSFGSQTQAGSLFVGRMLTVVATLRSQNRNVLEFMTQSVQSARNGQSPPSLLPLPSAHIDQPRIAA